MRKVAKETEFFTHLNIDGATFKNIEETKLVGLSKDWGKGPKKQKAVQMSIHKLVMFVYYPLSGICMARILTSLTLRV